MKLLLARLLALLGLSQLAFRIHARCTSSYIRVFMFHGVNPTEAGDFDRLLQFLLQRFQPASPADLLQLQRTGLWPHSLPGAILTFDDGLRSDYEIVAPLLEKRGFTGWFFVPIGLLSLGPAAQVDSARRQQVEHPHNETDPRVFMTFEQLRDLAQRHVVGCHTSSHVRLSGALSEEELVREIPGAKRELETALGRSVDCFAWVGGEEVAYSRSAARHIARSFKISFTTNTAVTRRGASLHRIERTHLEAHYPLALVRLQISGLMDLLYLPKRRRVATLLDGAQHAA